MAVRSYQPALLLGRVDERSLHQLLSAPSSKVTTTAVKTVVKGISGQGSAENAVVNKKNKKSRKGVSKTMKKTERGNQEVNISVYDVDDQKYHHLEGVIKSLLRQHKQDSNELKESLSQCDLKCDAMKAQYKWLNTEPTTSEIKDILANTLRENLELRQELLRKDAKFLQVQMDQINSNLRRHSRTNVNSKDAICSALEDASVVEKDLKIRLAKVEIELIEKTNILREASGRMAMLEDKCENLDRENVFLRERHQSCIKNLKERNEVLEKRCEKTDTRRKLESAGLSEEIRECKWLLKNLSRNVNKCARLYTDAKMEVVKEECASQKTKDDALYLEDEHGKPDRLSNWFMNTHPRIAQKAMSVWTEYLGRIVTGLEDRVSQIKKTNQMGNEEDLEVLYKNRTPEQESFTTVGVDGERCVSSWKTNRNLFQVEETDPRKIGKGKRGHEKHNKIASSAVPPSPTWLRICQKAGLSPEDYFRPQTGFTIDD